MRFLSADQISSIEDRHTPHTVTESTTAWSGRIVDMVEDHVVVVEGQEPVVRQYTRHPGAVAVVAMRGEEGAEEILLLRQYRHPVRAMLWEIPAGLLDVAGEDPLTAARRELAEETDYEAASWHVLVDVYASPGFTTEGGRSFLARGLSPLPEAARIPREAEEAEFVPTWFRFDDVVDAVLAGRLHNPSTVMGVLAADRARARGWEGLREAGAGWLRSPRSL